MATYPSTLPNPLIDGYSVAPAQAFVRTEVETGVARQRQRYSSNPSMISVRWQYTPDQMAIFKPFYKLDCLNGAGWFDISLDVGDGLASYSARFSSPYKANVFGAINWEVTATLEVQNA